MTTAVKERPAPAIEETVDHDIKLDEVIRPDQYYSQQQLFQDLAIAREEFAKGVKKYCNYYHSAHDGKRYHGEQLIRWIRAENVEWKPSQSAVDLVLRLRKAKELRNNKPAQQEPDRSLAARAFEKNISDARKKELVEAKQREKNLLDYYAIIRRDVEGKVDTKDVDRLSKLIQKLELTTDRIDADTKIVRRALKSQTMHAQLGNLKQQMHHARQEYESYKAKHEAELDKKRREYDLAYSAHSRAASAANDLVVEAKKRPEFFTRDGVPQLRTVESTTK